MRGLKPITKVKLVLKEGLIRELVVDSWVVRTGPESIWLKESALVAGRSHL